MEYDNDKVIQTTQLAASIDKDDIQTNNKQQLPIKTSALSSLHTIKYTKLTISMNIIILLYYGIVG